MLLFFYNFLKIMEKVFTNREIGGNNSGVSGEKW